MLALPVLLRIYPRSPSSPPIPLHALALIPLTLAKVQLSLTLTLFPLHDLVLWTDGSVPFPFGKGGSGVLEDLAAFSAREVKRAAAEERERDEYFSAEGQWESK